MIISILIFILILSLLILSHEFGHFIIGRLNGIRVNEFTVGFGPKLFSFEKNGTLFVLRLLPLGGACIFDGMEAAMDDEAEIDEHSFPNASAGKKIATLAAGPLANFVLAFLCALILVSFCGADKPVVQAIMDNSAAQECGLQAGDVIKKIDGEHIHLYREVSMFSLMNTDGRQLKIEYERNGERYTTVLKPKYDNEDQRYYIGFRGSGEYIECNPLQVFQYSAYEIQYWGRYSVKSIGMLFTGKTGMDALNGPVAMADMVDESYDAAKSYGTLSVFLTMLNLLTLLSVNLGIVNLLPIPALDGGRLVFAFAEFITGKKIPPEKEGIVHLIGILFFIILTVVVMYHDIMRIIR